MSGAGENPRLDSVDLLRGVVMVLMALDHVRDFFTNFLFSPLDVSHTNTPLFLTRWITHYCAPVFVFLAGSGAYLSISRGKTPAELSRFLLTRGLWLVVLELTLIRCFGWFFNFDFHMNVAVVLWAIGWSMVVMSALVRFPLRAVAVFGMLMIGTHNLLDGIKPQLFGSLGWLWIMLHAGGRIEFSPGYLLLVGYPLIPWVGVMAAGYAFGHWLELKTYRRKKLILRLGIGLTAGFVMLRAANIYGDPGRWSAQQNLLFTAFSFVNCEKYPPSLLYLLMTLGPAMIFLALFDDKRISGPIGRALVVFGRVPLFYYLIHIPLLHLIAVGLAYFRYGRADWLLRNPGFVQNFPGRPADYGYGLSGVYLVWLAVVLILYPLCLWFANLKQRRREAWLSYL
jgi:uncharacterized membrane protein